MEHHCITHQQSLCEKKKTLKFEHVKKVVVSVVNFIRFYGLNDGQFESFLSETDAEYGDVLFHTEVRQLFRGAVLKQTFFSFETRNVSKFL
jgi:hypothetical protein